MSNYYTQHIVVSMILDDELKIETTEIAQRAATVVISELISDLGGVISDSGETNKRCMSSVLNDSAQRLGVSYDVLRGRLRTYKKHMYQRLPAYKVQSILGSNHTIAENLSTETFYTCLARYVLSVKSTKEALRKYKLEDEKVTKISYIIWSIPSNRSWHASSIIVDTLSSMITVDGRVSDIDFEKARINVRHSVKDVASLKSYIKQYQRWLFKFARKETILHIFHKHTRFPFMDLSKFMRMLAEHIVDVW